LEPEGLNDPARTGQQNELKRLSHSMHNTGDPSIGAEIQALVEHHLSDRPGEWRVSIVGSRESDGWEMKVWGPNGFERSYTLAGSAGEHQPIVIANVLMRLLPEKMVQG
jgi:hypothetical protein